MVDGNICRVADIAKAALQKPEDDFAERRGAAGAEISGAAILIWPRADPLAARHTSIENARTFPV